MNKTNLKVQPAKLLRNPSNDDSILPEPSDEFVFTPYVQ